MSLWTYTSSQQESRNTTDQQEDWKTSDFYDESDQWEGRNTYDFQEDWNTSTVSGQYKDRETSDQSEDKSTYS